MTHSEKKFTRKVFGFFKKISHEEKCEQSENDKVQKNMQSKFVFVFLGNRRPNKFYF